LKEQALSYIGYCSFHFAYDKMKTAIVTSIPWSLVVSVFAILRKAHY